MTEGSGMEETEYVVQMTIRQIVRAASPDEAKRLALRAVETVSRDTLWSASVVDPDEDTLVWRNYE